MRAKHRREIAPLFTLRICPKTCAGPLRRSLYFINAEQNTLKGGACVDRERGVRVYAHRYFCTGLFAMQLGRTASMHDCLLYLRTPHSHAGIECTREVLCCRCSEAVLFLALLVVSTLAEDVDLPVATQGTEQWAGVVAKAMTVNGRSQAESLQALKSFQSSVMQRLGKTVS